MNHSRRTATLTAAFALTAALTGCGTPTATGPVTPAAAPTSAVQLHAQPVAQTRAATRTVTRTIARRTITRTRTVTRTVRVTVTPTTAKPPAGSISDGMWRVGTDIQPGTYRTNGGTGCYWERLRDATGSLNSVIANGLPTGPAFVEVAASDAYFQTHGCGAWARQ